MSESKGPGALQSRLLVLIALFGLILALVLYRRAPGPLPAEPIGTASSENATVTIQEAVRTLLYIPLYHAIESGFFANQHIDVKLTTAGSATDAFAAMATGRADFAQADPMYVPIANEKGGATQVVAQVVGRIAVWGVTTKPGLESLTSESMRSLRISTHPAPMTAYTYMIRLADQFGLKPETDFSVVQSAPGTETVPLFNGQADVAFTLEPNVSMAEAQGARVVYSFPVELGDVIFTALMTRKEVIESRPDVVRRVVAAYEAALGDLRNNPARALATAETYFPNTAKSVLQRALSRMMDENVIPTSVMVSEESWNRAIEARVKAGDLSRAVPLTDSADLQLMQAAAGAGAAR